MPDKVVCSMCLVPLFRFSPYHEEALEFPDNRLAQGGINNILSGLVDSITKIPFDFVDV